MNIGWVVLALALPPMYAFLHAIAAPLYLQLRGDRNEWKRRPIPPERPAPHIGTYATSQLLHDVDLTQWLPRQRVPLPAETEETTAA